MRKPSLPAALLYAALLLCCTALHADPSLGLPERLISYKPVGSSSFPLVTSQRTAPRLEYEVYVPRAGEYEVTLVLGPVMDFVPDRGMRVAVAFDDRAPQVLDIFADRQAQTFLVNIGRLRSLGTTCATCALAMK